MGTALGKEDKLVNTKDKVPALRELRLQWKEINKLMSNYITDGRE